MRVTLTSRETAKLLKRADELEASIRKCLTDTSACIEDIEIMLARIEKNAARMNVISEPYKKPNKAHLRLVVSQ